MKQFYKWNRLPKNEKKRLKNEYAKCDDEIFDVYSKKDLKTRTFHKIDGKFEIYS